LLLAAASPTWANVYASGLVKTAPDTISYVLNENADTNVQIQVWEVGGAQVYTEDLGRQDKGTHTWTWNGTGGMSGLTYTIKIVASDPGYSAWTKLSTNTTQTNFYSPRGVCVNSNQGSQYFGRVYVCESVGGLTTTAPTNSRTTTDGLYLLNADLTDAVGQGDTARSGGVTWGAGNSPFKVGVGPDNNVYVCDYSDTNSGIWMGGPDFTTASPVLANTSRAASGLCTNHGSISAFLVEGTGSGRVLYTMDEDYPSSSASLGSIWKYALGTSASNYATVPTRQYDDAGNNVIQNYYNGIAHASDGTWWLTQERAGNTSDTLSSLIQVSATGNTVLWKSVPALGSPSSNDPLRCTRGLAYDPSHNYLALATYLSGKVIIFDPTTKAIASSITTVSNATNRDVAFDAAGNLYVVDNNNERLWVYSPPDGANSFTTTSYFTIDGIGTPRQLTINVNPPGSGTTTGAGTYASTRPVTVTASETEGYKFDKWTDQGGATLSTSASYTFTMPDNDLTINAVFVATSERRLTLAGNPTEAVNTLTGAGMYQPGTAVPVAATAKPLWAFSKWTTDPAGNNVVSTNASFNYTMPSAATTLYAQYVVASYNCTVTANPTAGGSPSVDGGTSHQYNTDVTVNANPNSEYFFLNWTDGAGAVKSRKAAYTFKMPGADLALTANYVKAIFAEGFEGLNRSTNPYTTSWAGSLDMNDTASTANNKAANGDLTSGNPWWGTKPGNGFVGTDGTSLTAHTGINALWSGGVGNGRDYVNLAYRFNGGSANAYADNLYADWWFYDRSGTAWVTTGTANYCDDPLSLVYSSIIAEAEAGKDFPDTANTKNFDDTDFAQKISLGMCDTWTANVTGPGPYPAYVDFDHNKYQVRVKDGSIDGQTSFGNFWYNINVPRSVGWHHARITIGALNLDTWTKELKFYIDDMSTPAATGQAGYSGINGVELETDWKNGTVGTAADTANLAWPYGTMYDDIVIGSLPQPTPAAPAAAPASGITTSAITWNWTEADPADGFHVFDAATFGAQKGNATATNLPETGLTSNKVYNRWVSSYFMPGGPNAPFATFESARTALATAVTLAAPAVSGTSVQTSAIVGNAYNATSWPGFTNPQGFGTDGKISSYKYKWSTNASDAIVEGEGASWSTGTLVALPPADGTYYLYLRSYNSVGVGNGSVRLGQYVFDTQAPTGTIVINNGDATTSSLNVTLTLSAVGATQMRFSNDNATYTAPEPYATTKSWTLSSTGGSLKTVYVKFIDAASNESIAYSDTISFEDATPVAKISDLWPLTNGPSYKLTDKVVTGVVGNAFWIEESDRSAAIKVVYTGAMPTQDRKVDVSGVLDSSSGQRVLNASSWTDKSAGTPIAPLGVIERAAGGKGVNANTPAISGGTGLYNVGMLVRIAGSVTNYSTANPTDKYFYLDDGSGLVDGAIPGIKVLCGSNTPKTSGNVTVTGLVGVVGGKPVIIIRGAGDIP